MKHHTVITGTGRTGTTLLMKIFTEIGLDTGFSKNEPVNKLSQGGLEGDVRTSPHYYVKEPQFCDYAHEVFADPDIAIDRVIIPMRKLHDAADSRYRVYKESGYDPDAPGGLWGTTIPSRQDRVLAFKLHKLIHELSKHNVPITLIEFPKFAMDENYLYDKLYAINRYDFNSKTRKSLQAAHKKLVKPELIHFK